MVSDMELIGLQDLERTGPYWHSRTWWSLFEVNSLPERHQTRSIPLLLAGP